MKKWMHSMGWPRWTTGANMAWCLLAVACGGAPGNESSPANPVAGAGAGGDATGATASGGVGTTGASDGLPGSGGLVEGVGGAELQTQNEPGPDAPSERLCAGAVAGEPVLRRLNRRELEASVRDIFPIVGDEWRSTLSADTVSELGFDNDNELLVVGRQTANALATTAQTVGDAVSQGIGQVLPCAVEEPGVACVEQFLATTGRRVFRRSLQPQESADFLEFFQTAQMATGSFAEAVGWLTRALLESPHFVYRREVGVVDGGVARLSQLEIATELAYTFTGTTPSEALLDQAESGLLSSPEQLEQVARQLLVAGGQSVIGNFFDSYVGHSRVTSLARVGVPEFAGLREDLLRETRDFIEEVVLNRGLGVRELLTAEFTTPAASLSAFYGLEEVPEADGQVVARNPGQGIGLLAQGAVLATLSQPDGSSPTKRGLWVFERLLCNTVPSPPPDIPDLQPPQPGERTTRQRYEEDHAQGSCQGCHRQWDPIGFGFEHFDEAGRYRDTESGLAIDASSTVPYLGVPLFSFNGQEDLMRQLVEQPIVHECLGDHLTSYAFGQEIACVGESKRPQFVEGSLGIVDYLASLAAEPHFRERRIRGD